MAALRGCCPSSGTPGTRQAAIVAGFAKGLVVDTSRVDSFWSASQPALAAVRLACAKAGVT